MAKRADYCLGDNEQTKELLFATVLQPLGRVGQAHGAQGFNTLPSWKPNISQGNGGRMFWAISAERVDIGISEGLEGSTASIALRSWRTPLANDTADSTTAPDECLEPPGVARKMSHLEPAWHPQLAIWTLN